MDFKKINYPLIVIISVAVIIRTVYLFTTQFMPIEGDAKFYDIMVKQLLNEGVFGYNSKTPNTYVTPGFPLFMAAIYKLFGPLTFNVMFVQTILSVLTVYYIYKIASEFLRPSFAILATALATFYPSFIYANGMILTEVLFTFLFTLFIYLFIIGFNKESTKYILAAGFVFGLSLLVRPTPSLLIIPFFGFYFFTRKDKVKLFNQFLMFVATFAIVMSPWWIRNYILNGQIILLSTSGGNPFLWGVHPYFIGVFESFDKIYAVKPTELVRNELWTQAAIDLAQKGLNINFLTYVKWLIFGKLNYMWTKPWIENGIQAEFLVFLRYPLHRLFVFVGWIGIVLSFYHNKKGIHLLALVPLYFTLLHLVYMAIPRYVYSTMPIMIILCVYVLELIFEKYEGKFNFETHH